MLDLCLKITNTDGSNLDQDATLDAINYPLNTICAQCDIILGDRLISQASATHQYRVMIKTLLNFYEDRLKSQFSTRLFYKDTADAVESVAINNGPKRGLIQRGHFSADSREFHLCGPLHANIFFCKRLLFNSVDWIIRLTWGNNTLCLMSPDNDIKLQFKNYWVLPCLSRKPLSPAVRLGHLAASLKGNTLYPLSRKG